MSITQSAYRLISLGLMDGKSEQDTVVNLAKLYQTSTNKVNHFLVPETLLQTVESQELAEKYQRAYRVAGIQCKIELPEEVTTATLLKTKPDTAKTTAVESNNPYHSPQAAVYDPNTLGEVQYVGFWARFVASLLDSILLLIISGFIVFAYFSIFNIDIFEGDLSSFEQSSFMAFSMVSNFLPMILVIAFWRYWGATPGKMAFSAKIVDAKTGEPPSTGRLILRFFAYIISALPFYLGFVWIAFDKRKQSWHDKLARTVVIKQYKS